MSEVLDKVLDLSAPRSPPDPEDAVVLKKARLDTDVDEVVCLSEDSVETGVAIQCSIEKQMDPDDTSILISLKFPDKEYDGEIEDASNLVSTR